jgi:hypothetical protein
LAEVHKVKLVKVGSWRTLESFWNTRADAFFRDPAGLQIKVRYGDGWPFGWDSQKQTLNGIQDKKLSVSGASIVYARMQAKAAHDTEVGYTVVLPGP